MNKKIIAIFVLILTYASCSIDTPIEKSVVLNNERNFCVSTICETAKFNENTNKCEKLAIVCRDDDNVCTETLSNCDIAIGCHKPVVCNDNNPCTKDSCDSTNGCIFEPVSSSLQRLEYDCKYHICDNGKDIIIKNKNNKVCFDGDPCTKDLCYKGECSHPIIQTRQCIEEDRRNRIYRNNNLIIAAQERLMRQETCENRISQNSSAIEECGHLDYQSDDGSKKYTYRYSGGAWVCWYHSYNNSWDCTQFFD